MLLYEKYIFYFGQKVDHKKINDSLKLYSIFIEENIVNSRKNINYYLQNNI